MVIINCSCIRMFLNDAPTMIDLSSWYDCSRAVQDVVDNDEVEVKHER